jgi:hypothetical protein
VLERSYKKFRTGGGQFFRTAQDCTATSSGGNFVSGVPVVNRRVLHTGQRQQLPVIKQDSVTGSR